MIINTDVYRRPRTVTDPTISEIGGIPKYYCERRQRKYTKPNQNVTKSEIVTNGETLTSTIRLACDRTNTGK